MISMVTVVPLLRDGGIHALKLVHFNRLETACTSIIDYIERDPLFFVKSDVTGKLILMMVLAFKMYVEAIFTFKKCR